MDGRVNLIVRLPANHAKNRCYATHIRVACVLRILSLSALVQRHDANIM